MHNFNMAFSNNKSNILIHLTQWQYWWWFWFTFLWVLYYLLVARVFRFRTLKFNPRIATTLRPHGKWGDILTCLIPITWCINILINSNFILKMIEWQSESSLFLLRVRAKQWFWIYKLDLRTISDVQTAPKNYGRNKWVCYTFGDLQKSDNYLSILAKKHKSIWVKEYWAKLEEDYKKILPNVRFFSPILGYKNELAKNMQISHLNDILNKSNLFYSNINDCFYNSYKSNLFKNNKNFYKNVLELNGFLFFKKVVTADEHSGLLRNVVNYKSNWNNHSYNYTDSFLKKEILFSNIRFKVKPLQQKTPKLFLNSYNNLNDFSIKDFTFNNMNKIHKNTFKDSFSNHDSSFYIFSVKDSNFFNDKTSPKNSIAYQHKKHTINDFRRFIFFKKLFLKALNFPNLNFNKFREIGYFNIKTFDTIKMSSKLPVDEYNNFLKKQKIKKMIEFELFLKGYPSPENNFFFHLKNDFRFKNDSCKGKIFYKNYNSFFNKRKNFGKLYSRVSLLNFDFLKKKADISKKIKKSNLLNKNSNIEVLNKKVTLPFNNYFKPKKILYQNNTYFTKSDFVDHLSENELLKLEKPYYFSDAYLKKNDIFKKIRKFDLSNINNTLELFNKEIVLPYNKYFKLKKSYYFSTTSHQKFDIFKKIRKFDLSNINNTLEVLNKEMIPSYNNYFKPTALPFDKYFKPNKIVYHDNSYITRPNFLDYWADNKPLKPKKPYYFSDAYLKKNDIFKKIKKFDLSNINNTLELFNKEIVLPFNKYFKLKKSYYFSTTSHHKFDIFEKIRKFDLSNINNTLEVLNKEMIPSYNNYFKPTALPFDKYFKPNKIVYHDNSYITRPNFLDYWADNKPLKHKKPYCLSYTSYKENNFLNIFKKTPENSTFIDFKKCLGKNQIFWKKRFTSERWLNALKKIKKDKKISWIFNKKIYYKNIENSAKKNFLKINKKNNLKFPLQKDTFIFKKIKNLKKNTFYSHFNLFDIERRKPTRLKYLYKNKKSKPVVNFKSFKKLLRSSHNSYFCYPLKLNKEGIIPKKKIRGTIIPAEPNCLEYGRNFNFVKNQKFKDFLKFSLLENKNQYVWNHGKGHSRFVLDDFTRTLKANVGLRSPIRILKNPNNDYYYFSKNDKKKIKLFRFRFNLNKGTMSMKPFNDNIYITFKQRRLGFKHPKVIEKSIENKNFSVNPFLKNKRIIEENFNKPYKQYKFLKKAKNRKENTKLSNWNRLLRSRRVLVLPIHVNITVITNSFDIVHSWHIPGLGLKMDCLPGRATHHTLYISHAGMYYGQCAEVCGRYHHHMPIRICGLPYEQFLIWWTHIALPKFLPPEKDENGKELIENKPLYCLNRWSW